MNPVPANQQQALVERLMTACGGAYSPETRRKFFITGPQWAAAYEGHALFHAATRTPVTFEEVIQHYAEIGIGYWCTHDTDVIPTEDLFTERQDAIVDRIKSSLKTNGLKCSMVTTETFHHAVFAASAAAESPQVREYAANRLRNTVKIGHELEAQFAVYWPGSLGYFVQGAVEETETLKWFRRGHQRGLRKRTSRLRSRKAAPTLKHCMEAKPFEPQAEILLPTSDAMMAWIASGLLTHPEMVGLNPEYLHELMWGAAPRAALARALVAKKLWHFDINDGYRLKHDVDIAVGSGESSRLAECAGASPQPRIQRAFFNLDYKPPRTTSNWGVFAVSFPTAVDRFHHTMGDGRRSSGRSDYQRSYGRAEGWRRSRGRKRCKCDCRVHQGTTDSP
jgi:xylose isomerase